MSQGSAGASSASSAGAASQGSAGAAQGGATGGETVDFKEAFQSTRGELEKTKGELRSIGSQFQKFQGETAKKTSVLDKLQKVLSGEEEKKPDPSAQWEQKLDYFLEQAIVAEKEGRSIPLTTTMANDLYSWRIEASRKEAAMADQMSKIQAALESLQNPARQLDHNTFAGLDTEVIGALDHLYGEPGVVTPIKQAQFEAVGKQLSAAITEIREKAPQQWDRIRRDPAMQKRLVETIVRQNLPPQAVKMIEHEKLKNTKMSTGELWSAFREAAEIKDPEQRAEIRTKIREQILEAMYANKNK